MAPTGVYGSAPPAVGGVPSVVMLTPVVGDGEATAAGAAREGTPTLDDPHIDQFGLSFSPRLLLVPVGASLRVTNSEAALTHNVHVQSVATGATLFDDDAATGDELRVTLADAGGYDVTCSMHPGMTAFVFASDAPYAVFAEPDGSFSLGSPPPGEYEVRLWTGKDGYADPIRVRVSGESTRIDLPTSR